MLPFTFALLGVVNPAKGQMEAVTALALACEVEPHARLLIVGLGDTEALAAHAERLGVSANVEYRGHVTDPVATYLEADAVLVCSPHEAMGRVTVEAMAAYCPVIGLDNGGTSELIEHGVTGLLYNGQERDLADRMVDVMQNNDAASARAAAAWSQAAERFSVETYAAQMRQVYAAAMGG